MNRLSWKLRTIVCVLSTLVMLQSGQADVVRIMSFNIESYGPAGSEQYNALVRLVQAVDPDILLTQEATNDAGRLAFQTEFAAIYPFRALGAADGAGNRQQTFSRWPLMNPANLFAGGFLRSTIRVDVDADPSNPGPEFRVYNVHWKSGSTPSDALLRFQMAERIRDDIVTLRQTDRDFRLLIGGDFNEQPGDPAIEVLTSPGYDLLLNDEADLNTGSHMTRIASGRNIDHFMVSATLDAVQLSGVVFNTLTFPPPPPPPALVFDSSTASDHLCIYMDIDLIPYIPGDLNVDGFVNLSDIGPFVLALTDEAAYRAQYPAADLLEVGDVSGDGLFTVSDIGAFVALLTS